MEIFNPGEFPEGYKPEDFIEGAGSIPRNPLIANTLYLSKDIAQYCGYKSVDRFKRNYLKLLLDKEKIVMTIPDKPKSKNQKYIANIGTVDYTKKI